jgi:hypothetical protein
MEGRRLALSIRRDRPPAVLRNLAQGEADARGARRMLAMATALDGMSREVTAVSAGMDRQTLRDRVMRFLSHRLLADSEAIVDAAGDAWARHTAEVGRIRSLCSYPRRPKGRI